MKPGLKSLTIGTSLLVGFGLNGCSAMIQDSPVGSYGRTIEERNADVYGGRDPWKGTPVVASRIVNSDGSIVFMIDTTRVSPGQTLSVNYADQFVDMTKYDKKWEYWKGEGNTKRGFIVTYTPK